MKEVTRKGKAGHGQVTEIQKPLSFKMLCVLAWSLSVCPSHDNCVFSLFQSLDRKKVLTHQRTFDSEGEKHLSVSFPPCFPHFNSCGVYFVLSVYSILLFKDFNFMFLSTNLFQRKRCTRTTRRRPYTMIQMRMQILENQNQITALWCNTDLYAPPGAS